MIKHKKKSPGRPKKEFVSKKPKIAIKEWPGRPRKHDQVKKIQHEVPTEVVWFVEKSVDASKRKDFIILLLFLLSFILFLFSLYFTFLKEKKADDLTPSDISEIANIDTGNIDYTATNDEIIQDISTQDKDISTPNLQALTPEQQMIIDFYQAINTIDTSTMYTMTDAHLEASNVFKTYYSKRWLSNFSSVILAPKIVVTNIQEKPNTINNPNIKNFSYTLEYVLVNNQQKFTEERSTVLIKKGDSWRIGKLLCETKGCSTMPFFNPDKYK